MGRRHLNLVSAAAALGLVLVAPAGATIPWRTVSDGAASGPPAPGTTGRVVSTRVAAARLTARLPDAAVKALRGVDFSKNTVVAVFGQFGCADERVFVTSIVQHGLTLAVKLVQRPLAPGRMECMALYATYRLLTIQRSALRPPFPTSAIVTVTGA